MRLKQIITIVISVITTIILIYLLLKTISFNDFAETFSKISPLIILLSFAAYFLSYVFRAVRFRGLSQKISFNKLFSIVCIHNFFNNIIPARIGELSYVYLIGKQKDNSTESGIASLVFTRIMDVGVTLLLSLLVLILFKSKLGLNKNAYALLLVSIIAIFIISGLIIISRRKVDSLVKKTIDLTQIKKIGFFLSLLDKIKLSLEYFKTIVSKRTIILSVVYSLGIVFTQYIFFYLIMKDLGLELSFIKVVLGSILIFIVVILPIQGIGGFGTYEGAWTIALIYFGISLEMAITASFVIHILQLAYLIILGIYGLIHYKLLDKREKINDPGIKPADVY